KRGTGKATRTPGASGPVERMLWEDGEESYTRVLYGLDASGTRLANGYWGVAPTQSNRPAGPLTGVSREENRSAPPLPPSPAGTTPDGEPAAASTRPAAPNGAAGPNADTPEPTPAPAASGRLTLYASALGVVVTWFIWPFIAIGALGCAGLRRGRELLVVLPLAATS